jgi:streptogramin lyase
MLNLQADKDENRWLAMMDQGKIAKFDTETLKFQIFEAFENAPGGPQEHRFYEITADSQSNCYFMDIGAGYIGRVDARTAKITFYQPPTPNSGPRRGQMDSQDRLWVR